MKPTYAPSVRVRYFNDHGVTSRKTYDYLVPGFINPYTLKPGEYVVVHSAGSDKPEVCEIVEIMPHGSPSATKPILGTANLLGLGIAAQRRREREDLIQQLTERERRVQDDPLVRFAGLATHDQVAANLYQRLAQLQD